MQSSMRREYNKYAPVYLAGAVSSLEFLLIIMRFIICTNNKVHLCVRAYNLERILVLKAFSRFFIFACLYLLYKRKVNVSVARSKMISSTIDRIKFPLTS